MLLFPFGDKSNENTYASYFWNRPQSQQKGIPLRAGYVVGYQLVKELYTRYTIYEIARLWLQRTVSEVCKALIMANRLMN
ncbi:MAG: hypothetical protein ACPGWR_25105 [Ardenticatenaceae bacterium]